jgi:hypothetical protein
MRADAGKPQHSETALPLSAATGLPFPQYPPPLPLPWWDIGNGNHGGRTLPDAPSWRLLTSSRHWQRINSGSQMVTVSATCVTRVPGISVTSISSFTLVCASLINRVNF